MRVLLLALAIGLVGAEPAPEPKPKPITQSELLAKFREVPGVEAKYREEKHFGLLAAPLVSEGTVHFAPPELFARHQQKPSRSSVVVRDAHLRFGDERGEESIDLRSRPEVRLFVHSFLELLEGDEDGLKELYEIEWSAGAGERPDDWSIVLRPKLEPMKKIIEHIEMQGRGTEVRRMEIAEVGGDKTITTFTSVDTNKTYSKAQRNKVFAI